MSRLWITWEKQRRNQSASAALNAKLIEIELKDSPATRYIKSIFLTLKAVWVEKPTLLFVQNPSIVLSTVAVILGKVSSLKIIVDAHNAGIYPREGQSAILNVWASWLIHNADMTIVTNLILSNRVFELDGRPGLLPDPLPMLSVPKQPLQLQGEHNILFICTWAADEPYLEVINAAKNIAPSTAIYITGNWEKIASELPVDMPNNIILEGFVSDEKFDALLFSADVIMDLTTRVDCMVCGAYEAVSARKPQILSSTKVLQDYFTRASIFTNNDAQSIAAAITTSIDRLEALNAESILFKDELAHRWDDLRLNIEKQLKHLSRNNV